MARASVDRRTATVLGQWAKAERRSRCRHVGVILDRIAALYQSRPECLAEIGLMAMPLEPER
jgi:hypothetical protein